MASNCFPSSSICSSVSLARGLSIVFSVNVRSLSEFDLDGTLGRADADADHLSLGPVHLSIAQVPHLARAELARAGVADPFATAVRQVEAALLAGLQDRGPAVGLGRRVAGEELDLAALA